MTPKWIPTFEKTLDNLGSLEKRSAERRVAEALNKIVSPDVCIFHSLRYSIARDNAASTNLEIDFLVVWKNRGFLILEVKGGRIDFNADDGDWYLTPRNQPRRIRTRSPVKQVEGQKNDFCNCIIPNCNFPRNKNARSIVERVLVFPDVNLSDFKDSNGRKPERIDDFDIKDIADSEILKTLADFVEKKLEPCTRYAAQHGITKIFFNDVINYLRPSIQVEVPLKHIFENAESRIEAATNEQKEHLSHVMGARWLLMDGPAGSAKTVLGLSAILAWITSGINAYYITANKYLIAGLRKDKRYIQVKDQILSIHEFLEMVFNKKIVETDEAMTDALTGWDLPNKGFSVVLDEAQDLDEDLYESLVSFLPYERLWVLHDNRQSLESTQKIDTRRYDFGPLSYATPYSLKKNCRNTLQIAKHIKINVGLPDEYVNNQLPLGDRAPDEIMVASLDEQDSKLCEILKQGAKEGIARENMVAISCHAGKREAVRDKYCSSQGAMKFGDLFSYGGEDANKIAIYHTLDFRGLEAPFVVVTDIQDQESIFRANYLAGSRAKVRLTLIRLKDKEIETDIDDDLDFG